MNIKNNASLSLIKGGYESDDYLTGADHYTQVTVWAEYSPEYPGADFSPVIIGSFVREQFENPGENVLNLVEMAKSDDPTLTNFTTVESHVSKVKLYEIMRNHPRFGGKL